jgi:hypothetical protein
MPPSHQKGKTEGDAVESGSTPDHTTCSSGSRVQFPSGDWALMCQPNSTMLGNRFLVEVSRCCIVLLVGVFREDRRVEHYTHESIVRGRPALCRPA